MEERRQELLQVSKLLHAVRDPAPAQLIHIQQHLPRPPTEDQQTITFRSLRHRRAWFAADYPTDIVALCCPLKGEEVRCCLPDTTLVDYVSNPRRVQQGSASITTNKQSIQRSCCQYDRFLERRETLVMLGRMSPHWHYLQKATVAARNMTG